MSLIMGDIFREVGIMSGENRWHLRDGGTLDAEYKVFRVGDTVYGICGNYRKFHEIRTALQIACPGSIRAAMDVVREVLIGFSPDKWVSVVAMRFEDGRVRVVSYSFGPDYIGEDETPEGNVAVAGSGNVESVPLLREFCSAKPTANLSERIAAHKTFYAHTAQTNSQVGRVPLIFTVSANGIQEHSSSDPELVEGTTFGRTLLTALTTGSVDPSKAGVLMKGSVAPSLTSGFTYTSTTTSITISWSANQAVYRADGTITAIGAGTQTITGLLANNTYYFYPYFDELSQTLKFLQASAVTIPTITGVLLNGTTQFIQTATAGTHPDPGASAVYSVEFWIKTTTVTSEGLLSFSAPQGSGAETAMVVQIAIGGALGEITFSYVNASAAIKSVTTSGASANDGAWHHVLISFASGGTVTIYVDGTSRGSGSALGAQGTAGANCWWHLGMAHGVATWPITSTTFLNGSISHVAIYNTALSANQVAAHCQSFVNIGSATYDTAVTNDSPSFYWKLIETSGTNAADSAGTNTGTYENSPTLNQSSSAITVLGTPVIAWPFPNFLASQAQNAQSRVPLSSGSMSAATPLSGTGGGSGGGSTGGGTRGGCFSGNTQVVTDQGDTPIERVQVGYKVLTARGTWRRVVNVHKHEATEADQYSPVEAGVSPIVQRRDSAGSWLMLDMGDGGLVTLNHSLLWEGKWLRAYEVFAGQQSQPYSLPVFDLEIECNKDEDPLATDAECSFMLSNGLIAHNALPK